MSTAEDIDFLEPASPPVAEGAPGGVISVLGVQCELWRKQRERGRHGDAHWLGYRGVESAEPRAQVAVSWSERRAEDARWRVQIWGRNARAEVYAPTLEEAERAIRSLVQGGRS